MATNKKKDSAALFELIDKSTLKVPKNSGSLKIPSWWSSKTNPPTTPAGGAAAVPVKPVAKVPPAAPRDGAGDAVTPGVPVRQVAPVSSGDAGAIQVVPATEEGEEAVPLAPTPLFSDAGMRKLTATASEESAAAMPESAGVSSGVGGAATSGTAGMTGGGAAESVKAPGLAGHEAPNFRAPARPGPISAPVGAAGRTASAAMPASKGVFAPATHGVDGAGAGGRNGDRKSMIWLVSIGCGVLGVLLLTIYLTRVNHDNTVPATQPDTTLGTETPFNSGTWTSMNATRPDNGTAGGLSVAPTRPGPNLTQDGLPHPARVWMAADVQWNKDLYYVVIATYPAARLDLARAAGEFIAKRGIDVVINNNNNVKALVLISYEGFPSNKAAEPLRNQIIEIGKEHPDARKQGGRSVWPTAYVWSGAKLVGAPK